MGNACSEPHWDANDDFERPDADLTRLTGADPSIFARRAQLRELVHGDEACDAVEIAQRTAILRALDDLSSQLTRVAAALRGALPAPDMRPASAGLGERPE